MRGPSRGPAALTFVGAPIEALVGLGVAEVLEQAECVRDLPDRSNHVLVVGERRLFVKRTKPRGLFRRLPPEPPEARGLALLQAAEVPCARVAFTGRDPRLGCLTATFDLAPAQPLDELLAAGAFEAARLETLLDTLADLVARLHSAGLHHRDLYLNHVYADAASGRLTLIDAERVARHRGSLGRHERKDLAALEASGPPGWWTEARRARFLTRYLAACALPVGALGRLTTRVLAKAARIRAHLPRTPVGEAARPRPRG